MALYTPFIEKNVDKMAQAVSERQQTEAARGAYMGDEKAMSQLYGINPQLAERIKQQKAQAQQSQLQEQSRKQKYQREQMEVVKKRMALMDYEQAKIFGAQAAQEIGINNPPPLTPELHEAIRKGYGEGESSGYSGTSMDAQVSNMLSKGVQDPEYRNTPEYARAWQLANEPKIIRTPTGDITLRPELSPIFRAPGDTATSKDQISNINKAVKRDVEVIPGTEKKVQTTADEKVSSGYYSRMVADEQKISELGNFDSADLWERAKGITNFTASPELQQYRQAADDWIRAKLRRESGAVIADEEMKKEYEVYFPQIGDKQPVIDQKKKARKAAIEAMKTAAGREAAGREAAPASSDKKYSAEITALEKELFGE